MRFRNAITVALLVALVAPNVALAAGPSSNRSYLGRPVDPGFGLLDLRNRWYDPATQRFLSLDPVFWEVGRIPKQTGGQTPDWQKVLRSSQALNPTSYASGNPIRYSDPEGRCLDCADPVLVGMDADAYQQSQTTAEKVVNGVALAVDVALLVAPSAPAIAGVTARGAVKLAKVGGEVAEQAKAGVEVAGDATRALVSGTGQAAKATRDALLEGVQSQKLANIIRKFYQSSDTISGGTAGAIQHEISTGEKVKGVSHIKKGQDLIRGLANVLKEKALSAADAVKASQLIADLRSALGRKK